jgi:nucleotide-binding universal stress UspA family protein
MAFYRVLVPLDGSELAEAALKEASDLTNALGRIRLVTAIDTDIPKIGGIPFYPLAGMGMAYLKRSTVELVVSQRAYLERMTARLREKGINADFVIRYGTPAEVIAQEAEDFAADVIVMSSHGRTGIPRQILGSVAEGVIKASNRPVFIIPSAQKRRPAKAAV